MGLAEDKVYTHITRNLKKFGAIRVASLANSLTCLVDSDRGWVQDLIQALHQNNAGHLADELQEVYDTWKPQPPVEVPGVTVPSAVSPEQGRDWLSRRPVCVDNGFFGNANHLHRGTPGLGLDRSVPSRDAGATRSPGQPRNEPEENSDISAESPPRLEGATRGVEQQPPNSVPKKQAVPSSGHGEPTGSLVDVRSPLLIQEQFDAEKKRVGMLQEHPGTGGEFPSWQNQVATREQEVLLRAPLCKKLGCWSMSREGNGAGRALEPASMEKTTLGATPVPRDTFPPCDTSVKSVMQEKKLPMGNKARSTPSVPTKEKVLPASANSVLGTSVVGGSEGTAGRSASRVSSATNVWAPGSNEEREEELSKPGALMSAPQGSPEVAGRSSSSREPDNPCSAISGSLGLSSDPILVSRDSLSTGGAFPRVSSVHGADPREKEASRASRDSCATPSWDSTSVGTHEVCVDHHPSIQLGAGGDGAGPLGSSVNFNSGSGRDAATSSPQARVSKGGSNGMSLLYILPAVGLISAVVFAVYARLRK
ncbi:hypothetical protein DUI87_09657 [Hirundo rustica rustica]|uniref:Caspase recruitment domain-containing protein n=1 Tax=Hirundo rustica rustica TaxID=333673 RepID=A0A3M0KUW0_HIRRU|nr:hypothetical protein DUI87_09657 [Hirundo rustica rustica]